jgi:hypothetical protein
MLSFDRTLSLITGLGGGEFAGYGLVVVAVLRRTGGSATGGQGLPHATLSRASCCRQIISSRSTFDVLGLCGLDSLMI